MDIDAYVKAGFTKNEIAQLCKVGAIKREPSFDGVADLIARMEKLEGQISALQSKNLKDAEQSAEEPDWLSSIIGGVKDGE